MIKVMVIDDSSLMRLFLKEAISDEKDIKIVTHATNSTLEISLIRRCKPDVVILDCGMSKDDTLETLKQIKTCNSEIRVIIFTHDTKLGPETIIEALQNGAEDFLAKPDSSSTDDPRSYIRTHLVPKIRSIVPQQCNSDEKDVYPTAVSPELPPKIIQKGSYNICAIGISAGGPQTLKKLLPLIPETIGGPILITIHMPTLFTGILAESLDSLSSIKVVEAEEGMVLEKGKAYIAPGGIHMVINDKDCQTIAFDDREPYQHSKPSANVMFESLLRCNPEKAVIIIMTGIGADGTEAMERLYTAGAYQIAQSQESSIVYGMPAAPVAKGIVHEVLNIEEIANRISELLGTSDQK